MKALLVGAGPVGCLAAIQLRKRNFGVSIYDREHDPRRSQAARGHSFNLTLSLRGLKAIDPEVREALYGQGTAISQRVIHRADGSVLLQPYGVLPEHHLLSIPRRKLHAVLLDELERLGVRVAFEHECVAIDPHRPSVTFIESGNQHQDSGDLLIGCDGANSAVRDSLVRRHAVKVECERSAHGYAEYPIGGLRELGFHVWPRGDFMLIAQPNVDASYTSTLFLPLYSDGRSPWFGELVTARDVRQFFGRHFPDAVERLGGEHRALPPAPLKAVVCDRYHCGRAVLIGDAAHTMLPFFGQGINCGFEDVRVLLEILDGSVSIDDALSEFSRARRPACDAITHLSSANLRELTTEVADPRFHARAALERALLRSHPQRYAPLYCLVAFSTIPYHEALARHARQRDELDVLCRTFDVASEADHIVEAFGNGQ